MNEQKIKPKGYWYDPVRNQYQVKVTIDGKRKTIGYYLSEFEAEAVYKEHKTKEIQRKAEAKEKGNVRKENL